MTRKARRRNIRADPIHKTAIRLIALIRKITKNQRPGFTLVTMYLSRVQVILYSNYVLVELDNNFLIDARQRDNGPPVVYNIGDNPEERLSTTLNILRATTLLDDLSRIRK